MSDISTLITDEIVNYLRAASLVAAVLTPLVWAIIKTARIRAPIYRHMFWLYTLIGIVALPAIWLHGPILTLEILPAEGQPAKMTTPETGSSYDVELLQDAPKGMHLQRLASTDATVIGQANQSHHFPVKAVLAGMWLVGTVLMLIRCFMGWLRLRRICLSAERVSGNGRCENMYGGRSRVLLTSQVDGPVCFEILQPVIMLPRDMYNNAAPDDLQMVLNHELAHIERHDCWTNLLQRVIEAIFFFHPLVWYASFQLTQQREQICDNYVIEKGAPIMDYTRLLSRMAEQGLDKTRFQAVALFEGRLVQRVRSLLDLKHNNQTKVSRWATVASAVAVLVCLLLGTIRLEAKPNVDGAPEPFENRQPQTGDEAEFGSTKSSLNEEAIRPQKEALGPSERRPKGNCSIRGRVISAQSGEPVEHARVYLFYVGTHDAIFIDVASDGTFVFKDIPTGPFSLRTTHTAGFQDAIYNPAKKPGTHPWFSLKEGEERADVVLRVEPAYSIAGRVLDENDKPLRDRTLWVLAWVELDEPGGNRNRYRIARQTRITSDGSYLLDGLDGRPVHVMAIDWRSQEKDESYPPCYYPGTVARNEARKVHFNEEKSVDGVDIHLKKKGRFILEGIVTDRTTGNAIPKALITVHHRDMLFDRLTTYTDEQGRYRIESLGTGEFLVHVDAEPSGFVRSRKPVKIVTATETNQLNFTLGLGATISGEFVDENGDPIEIGPGAYGLAYKSGYATPETMSWSGARNRYGAKGRAGNNTFNGGEGDYEEEYMDFLTPSTFIIEGIIPGKTILRFHPKIENQTVKKILHNGQNIMETGIETRSGQEVKDVTIVIGAS